MLTYYYYNAQVEKYSYQETKNVKKELKVYNEYNDYIEIDEPKIDFYYNYLTEERVCIINDLHLVFYDKRDLRKRSIFSMDFLNLTKVNIPKTIYEVIDINKTLLANIKILPSYQVYKTASNLIVKNKKEIIVLFGVLEVRSNLIILR